MAFSHLKRVRPPPILAAFLYGFIIRLIPELAAGEELVGFDTVAYYGPLTLAGYANAPVLNSGAVWLPTILNFLLRDIIVALKLLGPISNGLACAGVYIFSTRALRLTPPIATISSVIYASSVAGLRSSWDLHRQSLGIFAALSTFPLAYRSGRGALILIILGVIATLALHEGAAILLLASFSFTLFDRGVAKILRYRNLTVSITPLVIGSIMFFNNPYRDVLLSKLIYFGGDPLEFAAFATSLYLPFIPFAVVGSIKLGKKALQGWLIAGLLLVIMPFLIGFGIAPPHRWAFLLAPMTAALSAAPLSLLRARKQVYKASLISVLLIWGAYFVLPYVSNPDPHPYILNYVRYTSFVPVSMVENTIPIEVSKELKAILLWIEGNLEEGACVALPFQLFGHAALILGIERGEWRGAFLPDFDTILSSLKLGSEAHSYIYLRGIDMYKGIKGDVLDEALSGCSQSYILWWSPNRVNVPRADPSEFLEIKRIDALSLYQVSSERWTLR